MSSLKHQFRVFYFRDFSMNSKPIRCHHSHTNPARLEISMGRSQNLDRTSSHRALRVDSHAKSVRLMIPVDFYRVPGCLGGVGMVKDVRRILRESQDDGLQGRPVPAGYSDTKEWWVGVIISIVEANYKWWFGWVYTVHNDWIPDKMLTWKRSQKIFLKRTRFSRYLRQKNNRIGLEFIDKSQK